jgi:GT2 family glycosyltransferase
MIGDAMDSIVLDGRELAAEKISLAVTTYGTQSFYTHGCLEAIREWKRGRHELIVACHDASLLLEYYLRACLKDGLIDTLIFTPSGYGHTQGVNRCFASAHGDVLFNVANDIQLGPAIVDDCANRLEADPQVGLIGWHWYSDGTYWEGDRIVRYRLCDETAPDMEPGNERNVRSASWFTGRTFDALGGPRALCLCNTAFFGIRRELWERLGGFSNIYRHYWADDFLSYAVLDQGLNVEAFASKFNDAHYFHETQYSHTDVEDRRRNADAIAIPGKLEHYLAFLEGGLSGSERQLLYQIARSLPDGSTVLHVGLWRGSGLLLFLDALREGRFIGIDCFDMPEVSAYSAQPPVGMPEVVSYLTPFVSPRQTLQLIKANTLTLDAFPPADIIFVDGGHTAECIEHDIHLAKAAVNPGGLLVFHDYGQPLWPDVQVTIDAHFAADQVRVYGTLCVIRV